MIQSENRKKQSPLECPVDALTKQQKAMNLSHQKDSLRLHCTFIFKKMNSVFEFIFLLSFELFYPYIFLSLLMHIITFLGQYFLLPHVELLFAVQFSVLPFGAEFLFHLLCLKQISESKKACIRLDSFQNWEIWGEGNRTIICGKKCNIWTKERTRNPWEGTQCTLYTWWWCVCVCMWWSQVQWRPTRVSNWTDCVSAQCETRSLLVTQRL